MSSTAVDALVPLLLDFNNVNELILTNINVNIFIIEFKNLIII